MLSPGATGERAYRQRHAVKRISMRLRDVRYSTMSGLLKSGSETYRMTAAQRALVPPCISSRDQRLSLHLDVVRPAGPDGVDAQVRRHGGHTAAQRQLLKRASKAYGAS